LCFGGIVWIRIRHSHGTEQIRTKQNKSTVGSTRWSEAGGGLRQISPNDEKKKNHPETEEAGLSVQLGGGSLRLAALLLRRRGALLLSFSLQAICKLGLFGERTKKHFLT